LADTLINGQEWEGRGRRRERDRSKNEKERRGGAGWVCWRFGVELEGEGTEMGGLRVGRCILGGRKAGQAAKAGKAATCAGGGGSFTV
jgi:hypothetical protein